MRCVGHLALCKCHPLLCCAQPQSAWVGEYVGPVLVRAHKLLSASLYQHFCAVPMVLFESLDYPGLVRGGAH